MIIKVKSCLVLIAMLTVAIAGCINNQTKVINATNYNSESANINSKHLKVDSFRVIDGDTIEIINTGSLSERVRLVGIDAPESDQPFGRQSKENLKQCLNQHHITVEWSKRDKYERILGKVFADAYDCNLEQVAKGYAWHYKFFAEQQPNIDRVNYADAESNARVSKLGLWSSNCQIEPYFWRKNKRTTCSTN